MKKKMKKAAFYKVESILLKVHHKLLPVPSSPSSPSEDGGCAGGGKVLQTDRARPGGRAGRRRRQAAQGVRPPPRGEGVGSGRGPTLSQPAGGSGAERSGGPAHGAAGDGCCSASAAGGGAMADDLDLDFDFEGGLGEVGQQPPGPGGGLDVSCPPAPGPGGGGGPGDRRVGVPRFQQYVSKKNFRQTVCRHWLRGLCMKGGDCGFLHQFDQARMPVCRFYAKYGECREPDCVFKHSTEDMKECNMFKLGLCIHGPQCRYKHTRRPGPPPEPHTVEACRPRDMRDRRPPAMRLFSQQATRH